MNIYVAGKFEEWQTVREVQQFLREMGHEITFDWTEEAAKRKGTYVFESDKLTNAEADLTGVEEADALIAIAHDDLYGTLIEIGMALADDTPVYLVGNFRDSVFWALPNVTLLDSPFKLYQHFGPKPEKPLTRTTERPLGERNL